MESMPVVLLGFMLGMLHAADADHVVAVSTIVGRERSVGGAARIGLLWGAGHTATVFLFGTAIILFSLTIPPRLEMALELCVALMLILLGVATLKKASRPQRGSDRRWEGWSMRWAVRPLAIGVVHGLAGSAAVVLLVLTHREPLSAVIHLLVFGIGTTAGMMLMTSLVALAIVRAHRTPVLDLSLQFVAGALSLALGGWLAWNLGANEWPLVVG